MVQAAMLGKAVCVPFGGVHTAFLKIQPYLLGKSNSLRNSMIIDIMMRMDWHNLLY